ncbi:MAG TPA: hypothetical protein VF665_16440 [Longimicrobium sp.]|jgi:hypothetical protein|uniref:hypothetical protein n=1 Tax=Longimicrobium sp. TaxID=2029185 RepID=UPI002EDAA2DC
MDRFYEKKWIVEAVNVVPPILVAGIGAYTSWSDPHKAAAAPYLAGGAAWLLVGSAIKVMNATAQDRERKRVADYDGLSAALRVLYATVRQVAKVDSEDGDVVRLTIHRVVPPKKGKAPGETLEQLLPYFCRSGGGAGRTFSIHTGIIGKAARERAILTATRGASHYDAFIRELVREYAFTEADALRLRADRHAWMAVPILATDGNTMAVVYLDSSDRDFFSAEVQAVVAAGCAGVTSYIHEAY